MALDNAARLISQALTQYQSLSLILIAIAFATLEPLLPHHPVDRRRGAILDVVGVVAGLAFVAISYGCLGWMARLADVAVLGEAMRMVRSLSPTLKVLFLILMVDFIIYWLHRAMHRWNFSWRMHRWHHSIEEMYWFAGFRASFLHVLLYGVPQVILPVMVFDLSVGETAAATGVANFVQIWTHTSLKVNVGPLRSIIVTPDYHRVHHRASNGPAKNLSNVLTVWDHLFGTYEAPDRNPVSQFGLVEPRPSLLRMLLGV